MVVPKKGTSTMLARPCRVVLSWLAFQQGPGVSCKRVLLLLLGVRAASVVAIFAHAAAEFIVGLHIRGVSLLDVCLALCACAPLGAVLCSVGIFAQAKQMFVCHAAPLVEHCDTYLWLFPALCWLVVNSGEVLPGIFSVGSGRGLRYAAVVLAIAFWSVFQERRLGGSSGGAPEPSTWVSSVKGGAFDRVSGRGAGQVSRLRWWDFVCPEGREVCFISRTLCALLDGSL
ncbi:hypothetical protein Taro_053332, partial [Colocasia esculenta]|nr:hypothetical protein [Colocasia esculenta]